MSGILNRKPSTSAHSEENQVSTLTTTQQNVYWQDRSLQIQHQRFLWWSIEDRKTEWKLITECLSNINEKLFLMAKNGNAVLTNSLVQRCIISAKKTVAVLLLSLTKAYRHLQFPHSTGICGVTRPWARAGKQNDWKQIIFKTTLTTKTFFRKSVSFRM